MTRQGGLTGEEVERFRRQGFLLFPAALGAREMRAVRDAVPSVIRGADANVVREVGSERVRMTHGAHRIDPTIERLTRHPRLVTPARQLCSGPIYVYQSRLNVKSAFDGSAASGYPWHQDFSTWHLRDGMPEPRALVVFVFVDDVIAANAPLLVLPGSHADGLLDAPGERTSAAGYQQVVILSARLRQLARQGGVEAMTGPRGSILFMHCALVHGSTENISPLRRAMVSVVYNPVDNAAAQSWSEDYVASDAVPVEPLAGDCLLEA